MPARGREEDRARGGMDDDFRFLIVLFRSPGRDRIGWECSNDAHLEVGGELVVEVRIRELVADANHLA